MTRIAVTGGSGKLGRAVVEDLAEHGYDVVNLDGQDHHPIGSSANRDRPLV